MAVHMTGTCLGVTRDMRGKQDNRFQVTNIHLLDGVHSTSVEVTQNFTGNLPGEGEVVVLDVLPSVWSGNGRGQVFWKALGRNSELENALNAVPAGK